jgi:hypothetical protein
VSATAQARASEPRLSAAAETAGTPSTEVWQLLGRADVIVRGCLEARDRAERRLWEERARVWLEDVGQAWIRAPR